MGELSREGHRKRAKANIFSTPVQHLEDYQLLECLLFYSVPRMDVKPIAYELINKFGSLNGVLSAPAEDLVKIDGLGEHSASLIKLSKLICEKASMNKNKNSACLSNYIEAMEYANNILCNASVERMLVITLNNKLEVISSSIVAQGYSNHAKIEPFKVIERAINDKATSMIIAHNHPHSAPKPSQGDIDFTLTIIHLLSPMKIKLRDHIIVGEKESLSMSIYPETASFFKDYRPKSK